MKSSSALLLSLLMMAGTGIAVEPGASPAAVRAELDTARAEARAEREALRTDHATQLAQLQRNADERAHALTAALNTARDSAAAYRTQLATHTDTPAPRRRSPATDPSNE